MISTPGLISILRKLYIQNNGVFSADELLLLQDENNLQRVDIENLFASILCDLTPKQNLALPFKEVNRFLLLQKAIESKESSSVCQAVLPHLNVLKENLNSAGPNCELSVKVAREVQKDIRPFAEKLPKLVKALNDYALLCEKYFSDITLLKRLVINIRMLPLADEANQLVEKNAMLFTVDVYWYTAELLYRNSLSLFNDNPFHFSVVRAFLDEAVAAHHLPDLEIVLPESLSLPSVATEVPVVEEPVAIETPAVVAEALVAIETPVVEVEKPVATVIEKPAVEESTLAAEELGATATVEGAGPSAPMQIREPVTFHPEAVASPADPVADRNDGEDQSTGIQRKRIVVMVIGLIVLAVLGGSIYFFSRKQGEPSIVAPIPLQPTREVVRDTLQSASPEQVHAPQVLEKEQKKDPQKEKAKPIGETPEPKKTGTKAGEIPTSEIPETPEIPEKPKTPETSEVKDTPKEDVSSSTFDALLKKAKGGNAATQYQVAQCYENGTGVKADLFEAITWYRKAKVNGSEAAAQRLMELGY